MLDEGAGARDALQIADAVDYLGANLSASSSSDAASVELHVPVARLGDALPIMADVALRPTFPEAELKRVREELLTSILEAADDPASLVQFAFPRLVYGPAHRYGTVSIGTAASLKGLTIADLRQFHASRYVPSNATLIVTGDVDPARGDRATRDRVRQLEGRGRDADRRSRLRRSCPRARCTWSTSRARRSRRSVSAGSACRARRPTTSRSGC